MRGWIVEETARYVALVAPTAECAVRGDGGPATTVSPKHAGAFAALPAQARSMTRRTGAMPRVEGYRAPERQRIFRGVRLDSCTEPPQRQAGSTEHIRVLPIEGASETWTRQKLVSLPPPPPVCCTTIASETCPHWPSQQCRRESRPNVARMSQFIPHARMVSIPHAYGLAAKVLASLKFVPGHRGPDRALPIQGMPARIRSAPPNPHVGRPIGGQDPKRIPGYTPGESRPTCPPPRQAQGARSTEQLKRLQLRQHNA